jgi:hypothetical protein
MPVEGLASRHPALSARTRPALWQRLVVLLGAVALALAVALAPVETVWVVTLALALLFVPVIAFRLLAAHGLIGACDDDRDMPYPRVPDHALPVYTLLVPLYREAHMLPSLITALTRLDYPAAKLDIKLILEATDRATIAAARAHRLPGIFEIVVVPELSPRTKPKALNYALPLARGEYIVIYDAEDRPDPGQLRQALHAFRTGPPTSPRCRPGSISITLATLGSPASSPSNIARCSTGSCPLSTGSSSPFRSVGPRTISAPRR